MGKKLSKEVKERMAMFRKAHSAFFAQLKREAETFPAVKISVVGDSRTCAACLARRGLVLKTSGLSRDALPPYADCTCEDGCRCCPIAVDKWSM